MKKVICGIFGTIYYASIDKNGVMGADRKIITDDAIGAVMNHMLTKAETQEPFTGLYTIEINECKLTLDVTGNKEIMEKNRKGENE